MPKTLDQRIARARHCLEKAIRERRELDTRQQRRRLWRLLNPKAKAPQSPPKSELTDARLERQIRVAFVAHCAAPTTENWEVLRELISQRGPEQINKMEKERGLNDAR
jgi:hypothetical protein